jgi:peptidoglycan/LPS O-acetylase OafA/YrhL
MERALFNHSIHGLRGCAALMVVLYHVAAGAEAGNFVPEGFPPVLQWFLLSFAHGVELFFMISGYLITLSLLRHRTIREFAENRIIRIYPAYLPILLLIFVAGPFVGYDYFDGMNVMEWIGSFIANLLFMPGIFPMEPALLVAWTLSYEALFYIFCCTALWLIRRLPAKHIAIGLVVLAAAGLIALYPRAIFFALGASCYFLDTRMRKGTTTFASLSLPSLFIFVVALFVAHAHEHGMDFIVPQQTILILWTLAILTGYVLFFALVYQRGPLALMLSTAPFQWLGTISYSLYLWHTPIMFGTKRLAQKLFAEEGNDMVLLAFLCSSLVLSLIVSWISYRIFEDYIPKLIKGKETWRFPLKRTA